jgi:DNA invertase Pin-like site-specific DNA recombinase
LPWDDYVAGYQYPDMRACIYLRVSTSDQHPENQLPALQAIARQRGHEVVEIIEERMSGAKKARPGLQKLLDGAHRGEYQVVLVWALDRLGRSMMGTMDTVRSLDQYGAEVISHQESWLSVEGPVRPLLLAIFSWAAEQERNRIRERTRAGLDQARRNGKTLGRPTVAVDPDQVRLMRERGMSYRDIGRALGVGATTIQRVAAQEAAEYMQRPKAG